MNLATVVEKSRSLDKIKALSLLKKALKEAQQINDEKAIAGCFFEIGAIFRSKNENPPAIINFQNAFDIYQSLNEKELLADCSFQLGKLFSLVANYEKAVEFFLFNLKLHREAGNLPGEALAHNHIGFEYDKLKIFSQSHFHYDCALKIFLQLNTQPEISKSLAYIGNVYNFEKKLDEAVSNLTQSLEIAESIGDPNLIIMSLAVFISAYTKAGEMQKALLYSSRAILLLEKISNPNMKINVLKSHGKLCVELGDLKNGIMYLNEALEMANFAQNKALLIMIHKLLSTAYEANNDAQNALQHFKKYDQLREETIGKEISFKAKHLEIQYDLEDSIKQKVMVEKNLEQKETEFIKRVSESEMKAINAQMGDHFIFNCMQSIQSFIQKKDVQNADGYLVKFSKLIRKVLDNSTQKEISLADDLEALENYVELEKLRLDYPLTYNVTFADDVNSEEIFIPPLLIQPFVENSIKHGLKGKNEPGEINIEIKKSENQMEIIITDNGTGRKEKPDVASERKSYGIPLTQERLDYLSTANKIKAMYDITDLLDAEGKIKGTKVSLKIPVISAA